MNEIQWFVSAVTIVGGGGLFGWWNATKSTRERAEAGWDAVLGKPQTNDRAGREMAAAEPGLIHRVSELERTVKTLAEIVAHQNATDKRVDRLDHRVGEHDSAIAALIATTFDRGAASALKAEELKNRDTIDEE